MFPLFSTVSISTRPLPPSRSFRARSRSDLSKDSIIALQRKGIFLSLSLSHRGANFSFSIILLRHVFKRIFSLSFFFPFFLSFVSFYFLFNDRSYLRHGERRLKNSCGLLFFTSSRLDNPRRFVRNFGPILGTKHR